MKHLLLLSILTALFVLSAGCSVESETVAACRINCALKPEAGLCKAYFPRFYFDPVERRCKEFIWGGCDGVVPFETLAECESCGCH